MIEKGMTIQVEWSFLWIVIISLMMNQIDTRFTCLAYVIAVIYIGDFLLVQVGIKEDLLKLSYVQLMGLVGILHFIEGILTLLLGAKSTYPVMAYRGKEVAGGYKAYGKWLIPLLFFSIDGIYIPIIAAVVYCNESYVLEPKEKAQKMGALISGFGLVIMLLARLVIRGNISLGVGILSMPLLHELIFMIDSRIEEGKLKYSLPKEGIRIMQIVGPSSLNMSRGDIIKKMNQEKILTEEDYYRQLKASKLIKLEIEKLNGEQIQELCTAQQLKTADLVFLPPF